MARFPGKLSCTLYTFSIENPKWRHFTPMLLVILVALRLLLSGWVVGGEGGEVTPGEPRWAPAPPRCRRWPWCSPRLAGVQGRRPVAPRLDHPYAAGAPAACSTGTARCTAAAGCSYSCSVSPWQGKFGGRGHQCTARQLLQSYQCCPHTAPSPPRPATLLQLQFSPRRQSDRGSAEGSRHGEPRHLLTDAQRLPDQ